MVWPAIIGGAIAAGGTIAGGLIGRKGAGDAAEASKNALDKLMRLSKPWLRTGRKSLNELWRMMQEGPGEFRPEEDPGFEYGYKRYVEDPRLRSASVRGRLFDPSTQKALGREAQDYASTKFDNFLARYRKKLEPYHALSQTGLSAVQGALQTAPLYSGAASAGETGRANALMAMTSGLSNILNKGVDYIGTRNILKKYNPPTNLSNARWSPRTASGF